MRTEIFNYMDFNPIYEKLFSQSLRNRQNNKNNTEPQVYMPAPTPPQWPFGADNKNSTESQMYMPAPTPPQGLFDKFVSPNTQKSGGMIDEMQNVYNPLTGQMERKNAYERLLY